MSKTDFTIITQNAYFGANLEPLLAAKTPLDLLNEVTAAWSRVQATNIPERAAKIAEIVADAKPDLVGLQEVVQWYRGTMEAMRIEYDFLELILSALRERGVGYAPIGIRYDLDQLAPLSANGDLLRLVDRHAVLLRIDPVSRVQPYNIQSGEFSKLYPLQQLGASGVPRSWIAVDASIEGNKFRFIESHLESYGAEVQTAQAMELLAGPAKVDFPVIMAGDFNTNGNQDPAVLDCTPTYPTLIGAGFQDAWSTVNPNDLGNTGVQADDLQNPESSLDRRIDLILARGGMVPQHAERIGATPSARTPSGLWPSDHAGILATLRIR